MTFEESAQLMTNPQFRGRVKVAALQYAQYLITLPSLSNSRSNWVRSTIQSPDSTAQTLVSSVVMNVNVQTYGANVSDPDLAAAVQVVSDMMM